MKEFIDSFFNDISIVACAVALVFAVVQLISIVQKLSIISDLLKTNFKKEVKTCDNCSYAILPNSKFCYHCGNELFLHCPNCQANMPKDAIYCPSCKRRMWLTGNVNGKQGKNGD